MTITELNLLLDYMTAQLTDKAITDPSCYLNIHNGGSVQGYLRGDNINDDSTLKGFYHHDGVAATLAAMQEYITSLPAAADRVNTEYLRRIAAAVDYATENSLGDEYVTPLRNVTLAMTENLLTHKEQAQPKEPFSYDDDLPF